MKMIKKIALVASVLAAFALPVKAETVSVTLSTQTTARFSPTLSLQPFESLSYTLSGTATGTIRIEQSFDGSNYRPVGSAVTSVGPITATSGTLYSDNQASLFRWALTSAPTTYGSKWVVTLSDVDDLVQGVSNRKGSPVLQTFDYGIRVGGYITSTGPQLSTATTSGNSHGESFKAYLGGTVDAVEGSALIPLEPVAGYGYTVRVAPKAKDLFNVVGFARAAVSTGSVVDVYSSTYVLARTTGTVVPGDPLASSSFSDGYLVANATGTVGVALSSGTAAGGMTKIRIR